MSLPTKPLYKTPAPMIDWREIDTVLLDMDGTILDLHFDNHFWLNYLPQRYAEIHQTDLESTRKKLVQRMTDERGSLNWYCLDYWSRELQLDIVSLKKEVQHLIEIRPFVREFLMKLHRGPQQVILITNAHQDSLKLKIDNTGIDEWFDRVYTSHEFGHAKEEQAFWQSFQQKENFDCERTLFIDDTPSVLKSAHTFGIKHLLTLVQPDSKSPMRQREKLEYPGIHHFDEIMPADD